MGAIELVTVALAIIEKVITKLPDWEQRRKDEYYSLKRDLFKECAKEAHVRDDEKVDKLYYKLCDYLKVYHDELKI